MTPETVLTKFMITEIFRHYQLAENPIITRVNVGFTNEVHFVDTYVLKVCVKKENEHRFSKEVFLYKHLAGRATIPELVVSDTSKKVCPYYYMIYKKIDGVPLASIWHTLDDETRESLISDFCSQLKTIDQYPRNEMARSLGLDPTPNWKNICTDGYSKSIQAIRDASVLPESTICKIEDLIATNRDVLDIQKLGLTYWDVHHDNILVNEVPKIVGIIDFEGLEIQSIDFRLIIVSIMSRYPQLYLSADIEQFAKLNDYKNLINWYRKYYPEMFDFPELEKRLTLYELGDIIAKLPDWPKTTQLHERLQLVLDGKFNPHPD